MTNATHAIRIKKILIAKKAENTSLSFSSVDSEYILRWTKENLKSEKNVKKPKIESATLKYPNSIGKNRLVAIIKRIPSINLTKP